MNKRTKKFLFVGAAGVLVLGAAAFTGAAVAGPVAKSVVGHPAPISVEIGQWVRIGDVGWLRFVQGGGACFSEGAKSHEVVCHMGGDLEGINGDGFRGFYAGRYIGSARPAWVTVTDGRKSFDGTYVSVIGRPEQNAWYALGVLDPTKPRTYTAYDTNGAIISRTIDRQQKSHRP